MAARRAPFRALAIEHEPHYRRIEMARELTDQQRARRKARREARKIARQQNGGSLPARARKSKDGNGSENGSATIVRSVRESEVQVTDVPMFVEDLIKILALRGLEQQLDHLNKTWLVWRDIEIYGESGRDPVKAADLMQERVRALNLPEPMNTVRLNNHLVGLGPIPGPRDHGFVQEVDHS
jgi:hypothetical protein